MTTVNDVKLMALSDLAELCKKLAEEPALTKNLRLKAEELRTNMLRFRVEVRTLEPNSMRRRRY